MTRASDGRGVLPSWGDSSRPVSGRTALGSVVLVAMLASGCGGGEVRVERVERQVELDADGRVIESTASSTTFVTEESSPSPTTAAPPAAELTKDEASDGVASIDCGNGAESVSLNGGSGSVEVAPSADETETTLSVELAGEALLDDLDGDGVADLAAAYRCVAGGDQGRQVALSFSLWHAGSGSPTRTAVATAPIETDWSVALPEGPGDGRVGLSVMAPADAEVRVTSTAVPEPSGGAAVLAPTPTAEDPPSTDSPQPLRLSPQQIPEGRKVIRRVLGVVDNGRLRLVSDGPPAEADGVASLPITEFPDALTASASGLGPLRLGATEAQLLEALALAVSQVEYPVAPACFGSANRIIRVGPIYFGLEQGVLRAIWVTDAALQTTDRVIGLSLDPAVGAGSEVSSVEATPLTVGLRLDTDRPPQGLQLRRFGDGWVELSPTAAGNVKVAVEATATGGTPTTVTGFGVAPSVCLTGDFEPDGSGS
ncbi:MAG: hypothetical protein R2704_08090 [Microthrixaceae bacterium]